MAQFSELDFQRLQETLLELKTRNYTLEDQSKKQRSALGEAQAKATVLQQELTKAQRTIEKSKKLSEVQKLLNENDNMQRKLLAQEEDFRLQNQTLLNELSLFVTENEQLKKDGSVNVMNEDDSSVLQMSKLNEELRILKEKNEVLEEEISRMNQNQIDSITDEFSEDLDISDISFKTLQNKEKGEENMKIQLESEKSEKRLAQTHIEDLKKEVSKMNEEKLGLKCKLAENERELQETQSSIDKLQLENKKVLEESSQQFNNIQKANMKLDSELRDCKRELEEEKRLNTLLQEERQKYPEETFLDLQHQVNSLQKGLESASIDLEKSQLTNEQLQIDYEKIHLDYRKQCSDLQNFHKHITELESEVESLKGVSEKRKTLIDEMAIEIQKKMEEQQEQATEFTAALNKISEEKCNETSQLEFRIQGLNDSIKDLEQWPIKYKELESNLEQLKHDKEDIEHQNKVLELEISKKETECLKKIEDLIREHEEVKYRKDMELENFNKEYEMKLELLNVQKCEFEESVSKLKQDIKDSLEDRKISEKKGHSLVKDLKRQLQQERAKNEKLQEKMKECFETNSNVSEPSRDNDGDRTSVSSWSLMSGQNDRASTPNLVSSPFHSSNGLYNEQFSEEQGSGSSQSLNSLQLENEALVSRLARLQEDKWRLEERVVMLEQSGAEMAEELVIKAKLIQTHVIETGARRERRGSGAAASVSRSNPSTPSSDKVRNFVDKLDKLVHLDSQKEAHKQELSSMQKMLEETLLKNLHLQQDVEAMSQEVVRLSKLASPTK